jgi:hypothetical protein
MLTSSFLKNLYPERLRKMSMIISNGYCLHLMTLFNLIKLLIQRTQPSFLGIMNEGDTHSLSCCAARTPIFTRQLSSSLKVFNWIQGTGYGLECTGLAFGSMSICTFCVDKLQVFHRTSCHFPVALKAILLFDVRLDE